MNILYGVAGEGSGHSSRAKEVIRHLQSRGHTVKVLSYDRGYTNLEPLFDVEKIFGLQLVYRRNEVQPIETLLKNVLNSPKAVASIEKILRIIRSFKPDVIFTDFEPLTAHIANLKDIPLISIDNQHRIINTMIDYPKEFERDAFVAKAVIRGMVAGTDMCIITNFFEHPLTNPKTIIVPPILREEILRITPTTKEHILVYSTSKDERLLEILHTLETERFIVYGFDREDTEKNTIFKAPSKVGFIDDLSSAKAVIGTAGFTLITEALHFGKPYFAFPIDGQFEQLLNAHYVRKLGYGEYSIEIDSKKIDEFINQISVYKKSLASYNRQDNSTLFAKIDEVLSVYQQLH